MTYSEVIAIKILRKVSFNWLQQNWLLRAFDYKIICIRAFFFIDVKMLFSYVLFCQLHLQIVIDLQEMLIYVMFICLAQLSVPSNPSYANQFYTQI